MSDIPPPPPGFTLIDEPAPRPRRAKARTDNVPPPPPGFEVLDDDHPEARDLIGKPTGDVHDGDTFRTDTGRNARLYGADAFELNQTGRDRRGALVPLGTQARGVLEPFAQPDALVTATGASTYGRPVVSLNNGGDAGDALLRSGYGIATPEYLRADPTRLGQYMEAERFARLNGKGAWSTAFQQPASFRHKTPDPWAKPQSAQAGDAVWTCPA
jgi:endonuclease YncB( thermonuclease family)